MAEPAGRGGYSEGGKGRGGGEPGDVAHPETLHRHRPPGRMRGGGAMKRVPLEEAAPGMVLAKSVTNAAGHVVVPAGIVVDERMITHLERMGKAAVFVESAPGGS